MLSTGRLLRRSSAKFRVVIVTKMFSLTAQRFRRLNHWLHTSLVISVAFATSDANHNELLSEPIWIE